MFPYIGTKKQETKHIVKYLPENIKKVYDVFAGSASVAKYLCETIPTIEEIHINDISPVVCELHKIVLSGKESLENFVKECEELNTKSTFEELQTKLRKFDMKDTTPENIKFYYILMKRKRTSTLLDNDINRKVNFKTIEKDNKKLFDNLLTQKFKVQSRDYKLILNELEQLPAEERADLFIYLDPPYLTSTNIQRDDGLCSSDEFSADEMEYIINLMKRKTLKIMLNIGNNGLYRVIFGDMIKFAYPKTYSTTKKKTEHVIICNY